MADIKLTLGTRPNRAEHPPEYTVPLTDFASWLAGKLKVENPLANMKVPLLSEDCAPAVVCLKARDIKNGLKGATVFPAPT